MIELFTLHLNIGAGPRNVYVGTNKTSKTLYALCMKCKTIICHSYVFHHINNYVYSNLPSPHWRNLYQKHDSTSLHRDCTCVNAGVLNAWYIGDGNLCYSFVTIFVCFSYYFYITRIVCPVLLMGINQTANYIVAISMISDWCIICILEITTNKYFVRQWIYNSLRIDVLISQLESYW